MSDLTRLLNCFKYLSNLKEESTQNGNNSQIWTRGIHFRYICYLTFLCFCMESLEVNAFPQISQIKLPLLCICLCILIAALLSDTKSHLSQLNSLDMCFFLKNALKLHFDAKFNISHSKSLSKLIMHTTSTSIILVHQLKCTRVVYCLSYKQIIFLTKMEEVNLLYFKYCRADVMNLVWLN